MADNNLFRKPDGRTGPAIMDKEPMFLPEQRKELVEKAKRMVE